MTENEAGQLCKLAADVRHLLDDPIDIAADKHVKSDERWQGPTAERVRGELQIRKGKLETMATNVEQEATQRGKKEK
ncbi:hypothetical protein [Streptomyces sp. NPDC001020]